MGRVLRLSNLLLMPNSPLTPPVSHFPLIGIKKGEGARFAAYYSSLFPSFSHELLSPSRGRFTIEGLWAEWEEREQVSPLNGALFFRYASSHKDAVRRVWTALAESGNPLIPLGEKLWGQEEEEEEEGWIQDPFGLTWQCCRISQPGEAPLVPVLLFSGPRFGRAAAAMDLCEDVLGAGRWERVDRYPLHAAVSPADQIYYAQYRFGGFRIGFMNREQPETGPFQRSMALVIRCRNQSEIDYYWDRLSHGGEAWPGGWLKDPNGFFWQIIPQPLESMLPAGEEEKNALLGEMKKIQWNRLLSPGR